MRILLSFNVLFFLLCILTSQAYALCVTVPEANLRSGPGTQYERTWEVFKYMPFKKLSQKGHWYKVEDVDGDTHWIYRKLVRDIFDCAVVKVDKANVRKGPGVRFRKEHFSPAQRYAAFKVVKRIGDWVKVLDEFGDSGWISRKLLWIY